MTHHPVSISIASARRRNGSPFRFLFLLAAAFAVLAPAHASPPSDPPAGRQAWVREFLAEISWFSAPLAGLVVAATEDALLGLDARDGSTLWEMKLPCALPEGALEPVPGTRLAVVSFSGKMGPPHPSFAVLDLLSGQELWDSQALGFGECLGQFPLPAARALLANGKSREGKQTVALLDLATGSPRWRREDFFEGMKPERHVRPGAGEPSLNGDQPPLCDTDTTMIVFWDAESLRKHDLRDGRLLWAVKPPKPKDRERYGTSPAHRFARAALAPGDSVLFAPYDNTLCAFRTSNGAALWSKPPSFEGVVAQFALLPGAIVVRVQDPRPDERLPFTSPPFWASSHSLPGMQPWYDGTQLRDWRFETQGICMVDPRDGRLIKSLGSRRICKDCPPTPFSNFVAVGDTVFVARSGALRLIAVDARKEVAKSEFAFRSEPEGAWLRLAAFDSVLVLAGCQNLARFSRGGQLMEVKPFPPIKRTDLDLWGLLLGTVLTVTLESQGFDLEYEWDPLIAEPVSATQQAKECVVFMTKVESDSLRGTAFACVRLRDGAILSVARVEPEFDDCRVTPDGRGVVLAIGRRLEGYRLE